MASHQFSVTVSVGGSWKWRSRMVAVLLAVLRVLPQSVGAAVVSRFGPALIAWVGRGVHARVLGPKGG